MMNMEAYSDAIEAQKMAAEAEEFQEKIFAESTTLTTGALVCFCGITVLSLLSLIWPNLAFLTILGLVGMIAVFSILLKRQGRKVAKYKKKIEVEMKALLAPSSL